MRIDGGPRTLSPGSIGPVTRPARLLLPAAHDGITPRPLLVALHGYTSDSAAMDSYFGLGAEAARRGLYLILPEGMVDSRDNRYWNATDGCCQFYGTDVDDVAYLWGLVEDASAHVPVDPTRIYFMGHSNGGFMSYRMACEHSEGIAAIASLAGSDYEQPSTCVPSSSLSVLQIHGDADGVVRYEGGTVSPTGATHPSAVEVVQRWAGRAGCDLSMPEQLASKDLDTGIAGAETTVWRQLAGCESDRNYELWTIEGGTHVPTIAPSFIVETLDWLLDQHR